MDQIKQQEKKIIFSVINIDFCEINCIIYINEKLIFTQKPTKNKGVKK